MNEKTKTRAPHRLARHGICRGPKELAGALHAMLNPSPLPTDIAADAPHEERHPMLYPGDTNRRGPSPITSLPAAINVWAYLTEHLVSTKSKIPKHKSVVVTHPDTEHPTAEPAWPDGTQLPHGCSTRATSPPRPPRRSEPQHDPRHTRYSAQPYGHPQQSSATPRPPTSCTYAAPLKRPPPITTAPRGARLPREPPLVGK
jgi:hypothetical protein